MDAILERRSVRSFVEKRVEDEKIEKLLRAAMQAPSAHNQQAWEFIVVRGKENLLKLSSCSKYASCLKGADVGLVLLGNKKRMKAPNFWHQDMGAATQNILLRATELSLGTVWFGISPVEENETAAKRMFNLDEDRVCFCVIAVGYPADEDANHYVDRYDESRITYIG